MLGPWKLFEIDSRFFTYEMVSILNHVLANATMPTCGRDRAKFLWAVQRLADNDV